MSDTLDQIEGKSEVAEEVLLDQIRQEIDFRYGQMAQDRREIERLKAESELHNVETRCILSALGAGA